MNKKSSTSKVSSEEGLEATNEDSPFEKTINKIKMKNVSWWYKDGTYYANALSTFLFVVFIIIMLVWYFIAKLMDIDIWNKGMKKWVNAAASLCKFFIQIILAINSFFSIHVLSKVSQCTSTDEEHVPEIRDGTSQYNTEDESTHEPCKEIPMYFLLLGGVISLLPSILNLLLLLITYGFIKAISQMNFGRDSEQNSALPKWEFQPKGAFYWIENSLPFLAGVSLLILTVAYIGYVKSKNCYKRRLIILGIFASIIFIFYSSVLDKIIYFIVFYPMNYINNYSIDDTCNDDSVLKFVGCIIWLVAVVFNYLILCLIYGLGAVGGPGWAPKRLRKEIHQDLVNLIDNWLRNIKKNCAGTLKKTLSDTTSDR